MMTTRRELPPKRRAETFDLFHNGIRYDVTIGYYEDHTTIGEVFINFPKSGMAAEAIARDSAVLLSLAIQYGVPLQTIAHAITRDGQNEAASVIGAVVDKLMMETV